jgi:hypothetical protein
MTYLKGTLVASGGTLSQYWIPEPSVLWSCPANPGEQEVSALPNVRRPREDAQQL